MIKEEDLTDLYERAIKLSIAVSGWEERYLRGISFNNNGIIIVNFCIYHQYDNDEHSEEFTLDELYNNLDETLEKHRKAKEEEKLRLQEEKDRKEKVKLHHKEESEKALYLDLKKKYENEHK